ncbi:virulence factor Mce family protein [Nocardia amikacinitolerans]|uniref:MlaD family protein n=1 Tax=Nocardia amikacinitolerans TaxID=756689 RepID=UPI000A00C725|nr:MlaD family protein [Nocardia amikacinitolerans]MCP2315989.1 virulence factor Mce family protein [Nocardia amikacinitolerans]
MKSRILGPATSLGSIAAVALIAVAYLAFDVVGVDWFTRYSTLTMTLTNSGSLGPESPVSLSGVRVGKVVSVRNGEGGVHVSMRVNDDYHIPVASTVTIENLSALGEPQVRFTPAQGGGAPYLRDGQHIDTRAIRTPTSIPEVARQVTHLMEQLDPQAISDIVDNFTRGLAGTEAIVPQLARSTSLLAATLLARTDAIHRMLTDLQAVGADMEWTGPAMSAAAPGWSQLGTSADNLAKSIESFVRIGQVPDMYVQGTGLIPFFADFTDYLEQVGPDLAQLAPALTPLAMHAAGQLSHVDLSALIAQALADTGESALRLQINVK